MADPGEIERHRQSIVELSKPGEALAPNAPTATVQNRQWFTATGSERWEPRGDRGDFHDRLIAEHRAASPDARQDRRAIVLAGPPGAGKSTVLGEILGEDREQFLVVDADEFKAALLEEAIADGSYEEFIKPPEIHERESAGERFYPMELASLVHEESSMLASRMRREAMDSGTNLVVDTVLSSERSAVALGQQLEASGYEVQVIDVEVPYEISEGRIYGRWQKAYEAALDGNNEGLGGRWVPSEYARSVFNGPDGPDGKSNPEVAAARLANECGSVSRYRVYRTTQESTESTPAVGGWEVDRSRIEKGGALIDTDKMQAAKRAAMTRSGVHRERENGGPAHGRD